MKEIRGSNRIDTKIAAYNHFLPCGTFDPVVLSCYIDWGHKAGSRGWYRVDTKETLTQTLKHSDFVAEGLFR